MFVYLLFVALPVLILSAITQGMVKYKYSKALKCPARMSGADAARRILDDAGLHDVAIVPIPGVMTDYYSPGERKIALSQDVYSGRTLASVGIAAHECGHAIQHARNYGPLVLTKLAWPMAAFGSNAAYILVAIGLLLNMFHLAYLGLALFGVAVVYQVIDLPVEFNASTRAKQQLVSLGIVPEQDMPAVRGVLWSAAMTYVAAMVAALLQFLYYAFLVMSRDDR